MCAPARRAVLLVSLGALPGCATIVMNAAARIEYPEPPWNGEVRIASAPAGARCQVGRDGQVLAEVEATPGTVRLERSGRTLEVRCSAPGYLEAIAPLRPQDDPAVFRMAPTGVIGLTATVISLSTARTLRYPGEVTVDLPPAVFATEAERAAWFARRRAAIAAARPSGPAQRDAACATADGSSCDPAAMAAERERAAELRSLDALRDATRVAAAE